MSVFTSISQHELELFLQRFDVGELLDYQGIDAGIDNSNYFVNTRKGAQSLQFVLTIFETISFEDTLFPLQLMMHLSDRDIPCAYPVKDKEDQFRHILKEKPAALVQRLNGRDIETPNTQACQQTAQLLGKFHVAARSFSMTRENPMGLSRWLDMEKSLANILCDKDKRLIREELERIQSLNLKTLPSGNIHTDLFRDNILFDDDKISGVIDLYFACTDVLLFDVAIAINDWCIEPKQTLNQTKASAMLKAYDQERKLTAIEEKHWPNMLRMAALRFWLSRLYDMHFPRPGDLTHCKDPDHMKALLLYYRNNEASLNTLWPKCPDA